MMNSYSLQPKRIMVISLIGLVCIILNGCNKLEEPQFIYTPIPRFQWVTNWLAHPSCLPPCFENDTPGVTSIQDVYESLQKNPEIKQDDLTRSSSGSEIHWSYKEGGGGSVYADNQGMIVSEISLSVGHGHILTVDEVVQVYGSPTNIWILRSGGYRYWFNVYLIYPTIGMVLDIPYNTYDKISISRDLYINQIILFAPRSDGLFKITPCCPNSPDDLIKWDGYKEYPVSRR